MKISEQWLREGVSPSFGTKELVARLTMAGLEVDAVTPVAGSFTGVVVALVLECAKHPEADKLSVCRVDHGQGEPVTVVCGAPNARAGLRAPLAMIGATLPNGLKITRAKLRGVESFGMLCGADELGIDMPGEGLLELPCDAPVGASLREYMKLDDVSFEFGLTPNRGDCLGHRGLVREIAAFSGLPFAPADAVTVTPASDDRFPVSVEAAAACPRYACRVIRNVRASAPSPLWLRERLRRSGIRSIDAIVDITNYVMLELGQPMHAFDLAKLTGGIRVRLAHPGERITLLDGRELALDDDTLLIADDARPLALAGIMGGLDSGISTQRTKDILLESAFFAPLAIAGRARRHGLHTDSSHRFERGVDSALQVEALERATRLVLDVCGGEAGPVDVIESESHLERAVEIELRGSTIREVLDIELPGEVVEDMLARLGMEVSTQEDGRRWIVLAPTHRHDIAIEEDLVEELARLYGYERLPSHPPRGDFRIVAGREDSVGLGSLRDVLVARGYQEVVTYSFVDPELQARLDPDCPPLKLANPISADMGVMRTTLWAGLLTSARHNLHRQQSRLRLFEAGLRFRPQDGGLVQEPMLAGLLYGPAYAESWTEGRRQTDFFDVKGDVESLLARGARPATFRFERVVHPALHPGQSASLWHAGHPVGYLGALHPAIQHALDIPGNVFLFEIAQAALAEAAVPEFRELSRFPAVRRDLAVVTARDVPVDALLDLVREGGGDLLREVVLFDVFEGDSVGAGRRSVAMGLTLQHASRTLVDGEVNERVDSIVGLLKQRVSASLRE